MEILFQQPLVVLVILLSVGLLISLFLRRDAEQVRTFPLSLSILALCIGLISCLSFNKAVAGFQFTSRLDLLPQYNLSFTLGVDGVSMVFLLLTLFIFPICFLASWSVNKNTKQFYNYLLAMELLLVLTFTTIDIFYFYVFFESLLIPMFILIGVWGARERRIKAAYYFFLYTLFGSLIMLFGLLYLYLLVGSTNYYVILNTPLSLEQQKLIWVCFFFAFAVKMPLFPFHIWLPEAHVEAPTVGSMLLASLLLKLGGYGFLRFSLPMLPEASTYFMPMVITLSLLGVIYGSLSTVRQIDLKRIIAYSSVAHMNLVMLGLFSESQQGIEGAIYLMVGHGVVSAALFFCIGIVYDRYHTRLLKYYGGLATVMPLFATGFFIFTLANMSFPGTSNFVAEFLLFLGLFNKNSVVLLFATSSIVLSAVYSVWLFNRICFGTLKTQYISKFTDVTRRELSILVVLTITMLLLGVFTEFVLNFSYIAVKATMFVPYFFSAPRSRRSRDRLSVPETCLLTLLIVVAPMIIIVATSLPTYRLVLALIALTVFLFLAASVGVRTLSVVFPAWIASYTYPLWRLLPYLDDQTDIWEAEGQELLRHVSAYFSLIRDMLYTERNLRLLSDSGREFIDVFTCKLSTVIGVDSTGAIIIITVLAFVALAVLFWLRPRAAVAVYMLIVFALCMLCP